MAKNTQLWTPWSPEEAAHRRSSKASRKHKRAHTKKAQHNREGGPEKSQAKLESTPLIKTTADAPKPRGLHQMKEMKIKNRLMAKKKVKYRSK